MSNLNDKKQIQEFLTVAQEYCILLHNTKDKEKIEILQILTKLIPLLYLKGNLLQNSSDESPELETYVERFVNEEQWVAIYEQLKTKFEKDHEFIFYNPINELNEKSSIAEILADIFQDLMDFTILYNKGLELQKQAALYECKKLFATNWGYKCLLIMKPLHEILFKNQINVDEIN